MMIYFFILPMKTNDANKHCLRFNLAELISESQTSITIELFLRFLKNEIEMFSPANFQLIHEVVLDWSWAEINAVIKGFNNMSVKQYLERVFQAITTNDASLLVDLVTLLECSSHLTKTMKSDVRKNFSKYETRKVVYEILGKMFECVSWDEATTVISDIIIIFKSPSHDGLVSQSLQHLELFRSDFKWELNDENFEDLDVETFEKRDHKVIYKDSAFYQVSYFLF